MALDGLFLRCIKTELEEKLTGAKVDKIYLPTGDELVLRMRSRTCGGLNLLLSARANSPRVSLTASSFENPPTPPMLCMLLRKRLGGATLTGFRQAGLDRILFLDFEATNELGDREHLTLAAEIMAQYSNVILIGPDGKVIDALKRIDPTKSSRRLVLPGVPYELPPQQDKFNLVEAPLEDVVERIRSFRTKTLSSAILSSVMGVSPIVARELAFRAVGEDPHMSEMTEDDFTELEYPLLDLKKRIADNQYSPVALHREDSRPFDFCFMDITQYGSAFKKTAYDSPSELLDAFYAKRDSMERLASRTAALRKFLTNTKSRIARKMGNQQEELARSVDREKLRIYAELIQANLYQLEKGASVYEVANYYDDNKIVRVPADPALSPTQNAQKYYKEYRKTYTAEKKLQEQIENDSEEIAYLDTVLDALERVESETDIAQIRQELVSSGYLKEQPTKTGRNGRKKTVRQPKPLPPIAYETSDGFEVLVGRNNVQNDRLSLKMANKLDMWLHTKDFPGSHVIIRNQNGEISDTALEEAACIAAVNSTARESQKAPVNYTLAKNLKKPVGAKPGKVIYHTYNTMYVTPDAELAEKLRKKS